MTASILAERLTDRMCTKHPDVPIVEVLFHSDKLKNVWVLSICPSCQNEAAATMADEVRQ